MPQPRRIRPPINMPSSWAKKLRIAPQRKKAEADMIIGFLPNLLDKYEAAKLAKIPAK